MFSLSSLEMAAKTVYAAMSPTPQICWPLLCERVGVEVWVKHENHTPIGAFKLRGGLTYIAALQTERPDVTGVIAATRGNHGQSIALAAKRAGLDCTIVVPHGNSRDKNAAMLAYGSTLEEHGSDFQDAFQHAYQVAKDRDLHFVRSFDRALVMGVASYALELFRAVPDIDACYVPIGLGSGICGVIAARDAMGLKTEIIGVTAAGAPTYALSFAERRAISTAEASTAADGLACRVPVPEALEIILAGASRVITVEEIEIKNAIRHLYTDTHNVAEGAGAAALAGLLQERNKMKGRRVAVILSGANIDREVFAEVIST
jgi:threonine dehydratase